MFVLEMIGFLGFKKLGKKIKKMSEQHPKQCVRELALEVYEQLMNNSDNEIEEQLITNDFEI